MYLCSLSTIIPLYFFLHHPIFLVAGKSPTLYYPLDDIAVNCGSSGNSTALNGRQWIGDIGSKYITSSDEFMGKPVSPLPNSPTHSESRRVKNLSVCISIRFRTGGSKGPKLFFTVKAGPYTLLGNFSVSLTADALGLQSLVKEFCVNVEENQLLIITFSPSRGSSLDHEVYAFINGIEVVSMPTGLYHTQEDELGAHVVGKKFRFFVDRSTALEMVQRLNVGGSFISSKEDTGMFREWSGDSNYLLESSVLPATTTIQIKHRDIKAYDAPQKVYQTSWLVLFSEEKRPANKTLNFTWKLPVDLGFRYLVRFHFCELEYEIEEGRNTEFSIFVNEEVAEAKADAIKWSGRSGVAVHRDYVVMMEGDRTEGKRDLLISLCPHKNHNHEWPEQIDAILKGLEVFKLSNPDKNLAGMNPVPPMAHASPSINPNPRRLVFASRGNAVATVEDEKEEEEDEEDGSISQVVDEQTEWSLEQHNALPQDTAPSTSNPVQFNENVQGQKRSKGNLFQRSIAFLAKGMDTRWKKRDYDFNSERSMLDSLSNNGRLQWEIDYDFNREMEIAYSTAHNVPKDEWFRFTTARAYNKLSYDSLLDVGDTDFSRLNISTLDSALGDSSDRETDIISEISFSALDSD
ncbi:hypothetical protein U1Q18_038920 [Sarracenia purpurea var. burkii]